MAVNPDFWRGRRVFVTGHTGFKGGWLALWLQQMGAQVQGYALPAASGDSLWQAARINDLIDSDLADIRDAERLGAALARQQSELVLHLAAQPLVRESYRSPADTWSTNVTGTLNLLEAVRHCDSVRAVLVVTTDKCYDNREWVWPYREQDALGGHDPYSSSKAAVELLCASWRASYLQERGVAVATARAGNVIGGGDWSPERLLPDILRQWQQQQAVTLRYPGATRPWQHVLEPLHGYLLLAQALLQRQEGADSAWNFGPDAADVASVGKVVEQLAELWPGEARWQIDAAAQPHEAGLLALDSAKARHLLAWKPCWSLPQALDQTVRWHQAWQAGTDMQQYTLSQIEDFQNSTR